MATPAPGSVLFFVGGDPDLADDLASKPATVGGFARIFLPASVAGFVSDPRTQRPAENSWLIPTSQVMCAELLVRAAERTHRTIQIVDVNRPGEDRPLVERFVQASDVLPIAVRADGMRLVGAEAFTPSNLRRFLDSA